MIIDCHVHLPLSKTKGKFKDKKAKLLRDMERNGVDCAILIPDNLAGSNIGDLDTCLKLVENEKKLFLLGTIDVRKEGMRSISKIDFLFKKGKIKGIKIYPGHDPIYPTDKRLIPLYKLCIKYNLPIMIHTGRGEIKNAREYNDPKYLVKITKKFPKLKIVISHYFEPNLEYCYNLTKNFISIYYDTSGLADKDVVKERGLKTIKDILTRTLKEKPNNVLFGTDYACCSIKKHIELINSLNISDEIKDKIFYKNSNRIFRLNL